MSANVRFSATNATRLATKNICNLVHRNPGDRLFRYNGPDPINLLALAGLIVLLELGDDHVEFHLIHVSPEVGISEVAIDLGCLEVCMAKNHHQLAFLAASHKVVGSKGMSEVVEPHSPFNFRPILSPTPSLLKPPNGPARE